MSPLSRVSPRGDSGDTDQSRVYVLVLVVETVVIAALYWLGRHFS